MASKRPSGRKQDDPAQFQRFLKTAKEIEVDEDPKALEHAFKKVVIPTPARSKRPADG
jgi:hypothetical protein